jgi:uncharacterized membrane protein
MTRIEAAVRASESVHGGEVVVAIECRIPLAAVWQGVTAEDRAEATFSDLRVWDTEANNGVLLYLLLAEHAVVLRVDRGVAASTSQSDWDLIVSRVRQGFAAEDPVGGVVSAVEAIGELLRATHPENGGGLNLRPDRPVLIR